MYIGMRVMWRGGAVIVVSVVASENLEVALNIFVSQVY